jgi:hypothetical protein
MQGCRATPERLSSKVGLHRFRCNPADGNHRKACWPVLNCGRMPLGTQPSRIQADPRPSLAFPESTGAPPNKTSSFFLDKKACSCFSKMTLPFVRTNKLTPP